MASAQIVMGVAAKKVEYPASLLKRRFEPERLGEREACRTGPSRKKGEP